MRVFRNQRALYLAGALLAAPAALTLSAPHAAVAADMLSAKVGKPLQAAQKALASKDYTKAMKEVDDADAVKGKSDYETYTIAQMRAAVAAQSGDTDAAIKAYDVLIASSRTPASAKKQMLMAEATMAYQAKDYAKATPLIEKYLKAGGNDPKMQTLLVQSYYMQKDYKNAAKILQQQVNDELKAKKVPAENQLQFLVNCYREMKDQTNETHTFVLLAKYYSKPQYWAALIHNLAANEKLPSSLQLNLLRLRARTGTLKDASDYMDMAERAMEGNMPQLAVNLLNEGYAKGVLGKDAGAAREAKLKAMAVKRAAALKETLSAEADKAAQDPGAGPSLTIGYDLVLAGETQKGLALMKDGLGKHPRFPDLALLEDGMAEMDAGDTKDAAATFEQVKGDDGAEDLAELWELLITKPPVPAEAAKPAK